MQRAGGRVRSCGGKVVRRRPTVKTHGSALVLFGALAAVTMLMGAVPAAAAGDPAVDRLIVTNPVPGWTLLPSSFLQSIASTETHLESSATNQTSTVAVEGWQGTDASQRLIVAIVSFPTSIPFPLRNAREGVIAACSSSTGNAPTSLHAYAQIPGSEEATCSGTNSLGQAIAGTSMSWVKNDVIVFLEGVGLPTSHVESIAIDQNAALPSTGIIKPSSSHSGVIIAVIIGAAVLLAIGATIALVLWKASRRRRASGSPASWVPSTMTGQFPAVAGWKPDPSGRHDQRYWSGSEWTEHVFTHGLQGIDPLPQRTEPLAVGALAEGGEQFWNGTAWVPTTSSDGRMRWNGNQWIEIAENVNPPRGTP